jgi:hypothetical protein
MAGEVAKGKNISVSGVERKKVPFGSPPKQKAPARLFYLVNLATSPLLLDSFMIQRWATAI